MGFFDFLCNGQSKAELQKQIRELKAQNGTLRNEIAEFREVVTKKNTRISNLEAELRQTLDEKTKQQSAAQTILREKRNEIRELKQQLDAALSIIDAREEDRKDATEDKPQPKRRRNYHRNSNGKFAKQEKAE